MSHSFKINKVPSCIFINKHLMLICNMTQSDYSCYYDTLRVLCWDFHRNLQEKKQSDISLITQGRVIGWEFKFVTL